MDAMDALSVLRSAEVPLALVHDEYGHLDGIVTPGSILAALAGAFASDVEDDDPPLVEREDGSWLISGSATADCLEDRLGINLSVERDFSTVAGFALAVLKHLPETGEHFENVFGPGDHFGERVLVKSSLRTGLVVALEDSVVLWISQRDFTRLARAFPYMETYFKDYIEKTFGGPDMVFATGSAERSHELERTH